MSPLSPLSSRGPSAFDPTSAVRAANQTPLARRLAERIGRDGPVSFRDWMDACLYQPGLGYYRRGQPTVGRDGDFLTSPEVHPLFGAALGHLTGEFWHSLGRPGRMRIAEVGPGTGALAESMLSHDRRERTRPARCDRVHVGRTRRPGRRLTAAAAGAIPQRDQSAGDLSTRRRTSARLRQRAARRRARASAPVRRRTLAGALRRLLARVGLPALLSSTRR